MPASQGRSSTGNCLHTVVKCRVLLCRHYGGLAHHRMNKACGFALSVTRAMINFASTRTLGALLDSEFCFVLPTEKSATCQ